MDGGGGAFVISGKHHHVDAHSLPLSHCLGAGGLDDIRRGNNADGLAILGKKHGGFAFLGQPGGGALQGSDIHAVFLDDLLISCQIDFSLDSAPDAFSGLGNEVLYRQQGEVLLLGLRHDSGGQRMLGILSQVLPLDHVIRVKIY